MCVCVAVVSNRNTEGDTESTGDGQESGDSSS